MGTNYYVKIYEGEKCQHCGRSDTLETLHIGKQSAGWAFDFNPQYGEYNSFKKWRNLLEQHPSNIFDEYDRNITLFEFYRLVESTKGKKKGDSDTYDTEGFRIASSSDFC